MKCGASRIIKSHMSPLLTKSTEQFRTLSPRSPKHPVNPQAWFKHNDIWVPSQNKKRLQYLFPSGSVKYNGTNLENHLVFPTLNSHPHLWKRFSPKGTSSNWQHLWTNQTISSNVLHSVSLLLLPPEAVQDWKDSDSHNLQVPRSEKNMIQWNICGSWLEQMTYKPTFTCA